MGKGTDLWDDSALIDAFNNAVSSYKAMHKESYPENPREKEKDTSESNQDEVAHTESTTRQEEDANGINDLLKDAVETSMPCHKDVATSKGLESQEENLGANICANESNSHLPEFPAVPPVTAETKYSDDQQTSDYNNLLQKYYDLEGQKQEVLLQLQQANYWNYQNPDQCGQAGQVLPNNASENFQQSPCSLCSCLHSTAPLIPASACVPCSSSSGGFYCCPQFSGEKKGKDIIGEGKSAGDIDQETDLADVLSAWYSAGFCTGRYLSEQSRRKASQ